MEEGAEKGKRELISGIETDAEQEAQRILSQAEKEAAESRAGVETQVQSILREAAQKALRSGLSFNDAVRDFGLNVATTRPFTSSRRFHPDCVATHGSQSV